MTAAAAVAGFGRLPNVLDRSQAERDDGTDDGFFRHTQATADDAVRATADGNATPAFAGTGWCFC